MNKALQVIKKYLIKPLLWLVLTFFCLLSALVLAIRMPAVQTWAVKEVALYLSKLTKHEVEVGYVNIEWLDELLLENVLVYDRQQNELIKVGSLRADFDLVTLISTAEPAISEVWLDSPTVNTIVLKDSERLNINELIDAFANLSQSTDTSSSSHSVFHIDKVHVINGTYSYIDQLEAPIPNQFDYFHFTLEKINGEVDRLRIAGDTFEINVKGLNCNDRQTKLKVHNLDVFYRLSSQAMEFQNLDASIGKSHVSNFLHFGYDSLSAMVDFNERVTLTAHLDSSVIHSDDLALFAPVLKNMDEYYTIWTDLKGEVVDMTFRNLALRFGESSRMHGRVEFKGLPELDETFVDAKFSDFTVKSRDLYKYVGPQVETVLADFGRITYVGKFSGFFKDFVAKGKFETGLGNINSDINIKIKEDEKHSVYQGKINTNHFNIGKLLKQEELIGSIDLDGKIKGQGFSYSSAKFDLDANIRRISVHQYDYKNVKVEANLAKEAFQGKIISADTNARFNLDGLLDFSQKPYFMDFNANFLHVDLKKLNLMEEPLDFSTKANLRIHGENLEDFEGDASFSNTFMSNSKKKISLDTIKLITEKLDGERYVNIFSDIFEINADGNFSYGTLASHIPRLYKEYMMVIENKKRTIDDYYKNATPYDSGDYKMNFSFLLKKTQPVISLFSPDFTLAENTRMNGTFSKIRDKISFNLVGTCAEIKYGDMKVTGSRVSYSSSKSLNHAFVDGSGIFSSHKQFFGNQLKTENLNLQLIWNNENILYNSSIEQTKKDNRLAIDGNLNLSEGVKDLQFKKIDLKLLKTHWVGDSSRVIFGNDKIEVKRFGLRNENQKMMVEGFVSNDTEEDLHVNLSDFDIRPIGALLNQNLEGEIDGDAVFSNLMSKNYKLDFDGGITGLKVDKFLIGNIFGQMDWKSDKEQFDMDFKLVRDSIPNLDITGFVKPFENNRLSLVANLDRFNLQSFEPFVKDYFSNIWGICSGKLDISGTLLRPNLTGKVNIEKGKFKFNFLNTSYHFSEQVVFDTSAIRFANATLVDTNGNQCVANGMIKHKRFQNISFDIDAYFKNLLVLDTKEKDNALFYGKTFASGKVGVHGPLNDMVVNVEARNEKDSELFIPINTAESLGGSEFITFVKKKVAKKDEEDDLDLEEPEPSQTTIKLDLDINPDMEFSLILDKQTGDIINGTGSGNLKINTNTGGDFNLFGTYTFKKGFYNFTLLNLVNKKFDITNGSAITWNGDALGGNLDIKAEIEEKASLRDILPETDTAWFNNQALRKRYPAVVRLFLKGNIMHPEINYKIQIKDYPLSFNDAKLGAYPLDNYVRAFLQQLDGNEQQLSRQVFSLLVFRKFFPLNSSTSGGGLAGQGAAGTVSSLLSSQLSSLISQVDEDLTVDIDLNGFNTQALNDLRVRLSYQPELFNKRIRITRDGSFTNAQNRSTASSIAGDWSLEYMITADGTLRLKMFTKNNYNSIATSLNNSNQMSTGFSFMHTQSFDNLNELIRRKKKTEKYLEEESESEPVVPNDTTNIPKPGAMLNKRKEEKD